MLSLILTLIALAFGVCGLLIAKIENRRLCRELSKYKLKHMLVEDLCGSLNPTEHNFVIVNGSTGTCAVCKKKNNYLCGIKAFIDDDTAFNRRQAEELLDKLTEK